jgi:hypothetical protein
MKRDLKRAFVMVVPKDYQWGWLQINKFLITWFVVLGGDDLNALI